MTYNNSRQLKFDRALLRVFFATVAIAMLAIIYWAWPRDIVDLDIQAAEPMLSEGTVLFTGFSTIKGAAESSYERNIECDNARYIVNTIDFVSQPSPERFIEFQIDVPDLVPEGAECRLVIESIHRFDIFIFSKSTTDRFESPSFIWGK